ncbi:hypothetical protein TURU_003799 [Turdus rufiventris]|nr:hypothetical protein TURU_003799 [Turdus rufiventris]
MTTPALLPLSGRRLPPLNLGASAFPHHRATLRLSEKFILLLILSAFITLCFGAFFFLPDSSKHKRFDLGLEDVLIPHVDTSKGGKNLGGFLIHGQGHDEHRHREEEERLRNKIRADHEKALEEAKEKLKKSRDEIQAEIQTEKNKVVQELKKKDSKPLPPVPLPNLIGINSGEPADPDIREKRNKVKELCNYTVLIVNILFKIEFKGEVVSTEVRDGDYTTSPDRPFEYFITLPNIQPLSSLAQLETMSSGSVSCCLVKETDPHLTTTTFQEVVESDKVTPESPFLQAKQPQPPQLFLIGLRFQALHQPCCLLWTGSSISTSFLNGGARTGHSTQGEASPVLSTGEDLPFPSGHNIPDTGRDAIDLLGHQGTLLAHVHPAVDQYLQFPFCLGTVQPHRPQPITLQGLIVAKIQDSALGLVKLRLVGRCPSVQPF